MDEATLERVRQLLTTRLADLTVGDAIFLVATLDEANEADLAALGLPDNL